MIDKVPETTTLHCTLPRASVERVRLIAERRQLSLDDAVAMACDRWAREEEAVDDSPCSPMHSGDHLPVVRITPDPPMFDVCDTIPVELPHSNVTRIDVTKTVKRWPERLWDVE